MGRFQHADTGKNKKLTEISPLLAFCPVGLRIKILSKMYNYSHKLAFLNVILFQAAEILKNG